MSYCWQNMKVCQSLVSWKHCILQWELINCGLVPVYTVFIWYPEVYSILGIFDLIFVIFNKILRFIYFVFVCLIYLYFLFILFYFIFFRGWLLHLLILNYWLCIKYAILYSAYICIFHCCILQGIRYWCLIFN